MQIFLIVLALVILGVWIYVVFYGTTKIQTQTQGKTKEQKKEEIIQSYKQQLQEVLEPIKDDKEQKMAKKGELLKKFSVELSRNIFFDNHEIREIILELSKEG